jgi:hypothetical protein
MAAAVTFYKSSAWGKELHRNRPGEHPGFGRPELSWHDQSVSVPPRTDRRLGASARNVPVSIPYISSPLRTKQVHSYVPHGGGRMMIMSFAMLPSTVARHDNSTIVTRVLNGPKISGQIRQRDGCHFACRNGPAAVQMRQGCCRDALRKGPLEAVQAGMFNCGSTRRDE